MPKKGEWLTATEVADLRTWIKNGVAWPPEKIPESLGRTRPDYEGLKARHWAWQPLTDPQVPAVSKTAWPSNNIDNFILAKLEAKQLTPVADADPSTLIRRVTYDLPGLPPTPGEIEAFLKDKSADAFVRQVDRLLQSPRFGERWGRHWLDVSRYGESSGPSRNMPYPHAWRYRDYVIDAVNRDIPFNRFIQEQIAGDLLPAAGSEERDRLLIATGFLALGPKDVNQRFKVRYLMDNVAEQIDTVTRSVLGLTVSCALPRSQI